MNEKINKVLYAFFIQFSMIIYAMAVVFSKIASKQTMFSTSFFLFCMLFFLFIFIYALLWQQILKKTSLIIAFAHKVSVIIWGIIFGYIFFQEEVKLNMIIGAIVIIYGASIVVKEND